MNREDGDSITIVISLCLFIVSTWVIKKELLLLIYLKIIKCNVACAMNNLPNDVQLIVYKYLHYSLTFRLNEEYNFKFQYFWCQFSMCFKNDFMIPFLMFRKLRGSGEWGPINNSYVYKISNRRGDVVADLPEKY